MTDFINRRTGEFSITFPDAPAIGQSVRVDYNSCEEPSAVDRLAAIDDPDGEAAQRVKDWEKWRVTLKNLPEASNEIFKRTRRNPANWIRVDRKTAIDMGIDPDDLEEVDAD